MMANGKEKKHLEKNFWITFAVSGSHGGKNEDRALMMEAVRSSETSAYSNQTKRRYIPEGSNLLSESEWSSQR
jgi:hypothetical protein